MEVEIRKKEFKYKGKTLEELKKLDLREFSKYLRARERRAVLRQFQRMEEFVKRCQIKENRGKKIRTHERDLIVVPGLVGKTIYIYNGQNFIRADIIGEMLGHKLGEFALTRKRVNHGSAGVGATKGSKHKSKK